jgi:hypothetical protein
MFYAGKPTHGYRDSLAALCRTHEVEVIILADGTAKEWDLPLREIGWDRQHFGDTIIYRVLQ